VRGGGIIADLDEKSGDEEALSFDDSSEEEDLEDEPDHYENDGFVVEDVEDEEASERRRRRVRRRERERGSERDTEELDLALEEEGLGEADRVEGGDGGGDGANEDRRKKRKRRKPTREELDEDDLMLIAENTGESLPRTAKSSSGGSSDAKFKRLKKNRDDLGLDNRGFDDDRHDSVEGDRLDEATLERNLFGDGTSIPFLLIATAAERGLHTHTHTHTQFSFFASACGRALAYARSFPLPPVFACGTSPHLVWLRVRGCTWAASRRR
jgi:transcription elongation factor SPT6